MARKQGVAAAALLAAVLLGACLPSPAAGVHLSALSKALDVTASPKSGQVVHAGEETITVTWSLNTTEPAGSDAAYKNVKVVLCYAPVSQKDRGWRKTNDDLSKDKSCQFKISQQAYTVGAAGKLEYVVDRDVPSGTYHVRAYALDASDTQVAYGDTGVAAAFDIAGITGIHASIKVAAGVFSAFSIASLAFFFVIENRKKKN